jgi:hypothetical protein
MEVAILKMKAAILNHGSSHFKNEGNILSADLN